MIPSASCPTIGAGIYIYGEQAIGVWIQQSQGWQVNNPRGRASYVTKYIYILYENIYIYIF